MRTDNKGTVRRALAVATVLGLLLGLMGTAEAPAKTKACKKGFVRNKAKRCVHACHAEG